MTGLERVMCAMKGEKADRVPFTLTLSLYGSRLSGCPTREYFSDPRRYLAGQREVARRIDPDILFTPFALPLEALAYGGEGVWLDRFPPNVRKPPLRDPSLVRPLGDELPKDPGVAYLIEAARLVAEEFGAERPLCAVVTAPVDLPAMLLGIETWLEVLLFDPEGAATMLDLAVEHFLCLCKAFFAAGAAFVASPVMFANMRLVTPRLLENTILPVLSRAFAQCPGPVVFHHGGNRIEDHLGLYARLPNVPGFVIDPRDSLAGARAGLGPERLLLGNLNGPVLARLSPVQAHAAAAAILADRKEDRRFILASGHADVPHDTDLETLVAIRRAVEEAP